MSRRAKCVSAAKKRLEWKGSEPRHGRAVALEKIEKNLDLERSQRRSLRAPRRSRGISCFSNAPRTAARSTLLRWPAWASGLRRLAKAALSWQVRRSASDPAKSRRYFVV